MVAGHRRMGQDSALVKGGPHPDRYPSGGVAAPVGAGHRAGDRPARHADFRIPPWGASPRDMNVQDQNSPVLHDGAVVIHVDTSLIPRYPEKFIGPDELTDDATRQQCYVAH